MICDIYSSVTPGQSLVIMYDGYIKYKRNYLLILRVEYINVDINSQFRDLTNSCYFCDSFFINKKSSVKF